MIEDEPRCSVGGIQYRWEDGHPLSELLQGHWVRATTASGDAVEGVVGADEAGPDVVGAAMKLYDGDVLFHSPAVCAASLKHAGLAPVEAHTQFWLARLYHGRLHSSQKRHPDIAMRFPTCYLDYFAECDEDSAERARRIAAALLAVECPDHRASFRC